jgi:hypothetical protein
MKQAVATTVASIEAGTPSNTQPQKTVLRLTVGKDHIRRFDFSDDGRHVVIYHVYPYLADWAGREAPDDVNPRSHGPESLHTSVAQAIERTVCTEPEDFILANRGITVLAESLHYDPNTGKVEIVISDRDVHGLADGATTDAVIAKVQEAIGQGRPYRTLKPEEIPGYLKEGRLHVEVILGIDDRDRIGRLVLGRNTSRQVKPWSISDFGGEFDWISKILERDHGPFRERVGYEENANKDVTILDVLGVLTLFHPEYDIKGSVPAEKRKAPTVAYSSKGRMDARLKDKTLQPGYRGLSPILEDILKLHDYVYEKFETAYVSAFGPKAKLGKRQGVESRKGKTAHTLPLTGAQSEYIVPSGLLYPLLASLRALVEYDQHSKAAWRCNPFKFFDRHGGDLVACLIEQVELLGGNPQTAGKKKAVYTAVHGQARLLLAEDQNNGAVAE